MTQEFVHDVSDAKDAYKLLMAYDGSGRRISKTRMVKDDQRGYWYTDHVTHYTGIGTEVRESIRRAASPEVKVVVNLPQGMGRYGVEDASTSDIGFGAGYIPSTKFEWYLKNHQGESSENDLDHFHCRAAGFYAMRLNHLGSTMLVYGTQSTSRPDIFDQGGVQAAYDYRAFGEQVDLEQKGDKVTENFTGKERDDETELNYFGARYLDPMLGLWTSVDPKRQFASPYLYAGNGVNPLNAIDPDGNYTLNLNDDNTVASLVEDDDYSKVSVYGTNGNLLGQCDAPPANSYFFSYGESGEYNVVGQTFDSFMSYKIDQMIESVSPFEIGEWGTNRKYDFKSFYKGKDLTIGVLNGTIMTVRDAGNAVWAGYTRWTYFLHAYPLVQKLSDWYAGYQKFGKSMELFSGAEDPSSAVMQEWGFYNYVP